MTYEYFAYQKIYLDAKIYYTLVNLNGQDLVQLPPIRSFINAVVDEIRNTTLLLNDICHNQALERHVKVATEASAQLVGLERRGLNKTKTKATKIRSSNLLCRQK